MHHSLLLSKSHWHQEELQALCCRWDKRRPAAVDNLVLLTFDEAGAHEDSDLESVKSADPKFFDRVTAILGRVRQELGCVIR